MFDWTFDEETNGLLLTEGRALTRNSEVMPVYATELHLFGLHEKIGIPEETGTPIAWYKRGSYYYEGRKFARRRDAEIELLQAPTPQGVQMQPVDLDGMRRKNAALLSQLEGTSAQALKAEMGKRGVRAFNVAYSGGKDSEALLLFALRQFPEAIQRVIFADTTMEFNETTAHVEATRQALSSYGIELETVRPYIDGLTGWRLFGVPSRNCRWCCQTCKSGALARLADGGSAYVMGARASESKYRASYGIDAGDRSLTAAPTFRPLFDWTSAEVWVYLLAHGAKINPVYRYGHHRACCLVCPFSSPFEVEITKRMAREQIEPYRQEYLRQFPGHEAHFDRRYKGDDGTWSRVNSQALHGEFPILDRIEDNIYKYILPENTNINIHWLELARRKYEFKLYNPRENEYIIAFYTLKHTNDNKLFKNILNRAFYCVSCGYCINYCTKGAIKILNITGGKIHIIQDKCDNCLECVKSECIRAKALRGYRGNEA